MQKPSGIQGVTPPPLFPVRDPSSYMGAFPNFKKPALLGCFSLGSRREFCHDMSQLKYYDSAKVAPTPLDLHQGIRMSIKKNMEEIKQEGLAHILRWILAKAHHFRSAAGRQRFLPEFVCYRGLLTTLMCTPYERREGWSICATMFCGTIYLFALETGQKRLERENESQRSKDMQSWGFKFEQYVFTDDVTTIRNTNQPVNENEEFSCVFSTRLMGHSILYCAEMDGIEATEPLTESEVVNQYSSNFVEAKTTRCIENRKQDMTYRKHKIMKWWAQCFTVGVTKVVCGMRNDGGLVTEVEEIDVAQFPKQGKGFWEPAVCMNFLDKFLSYVKSVVKVDSKEVFYQFDWEPKQPVTVKVFDETNELLIPEWYSSSLISSARR